MIRRWLQERREQRDRRERAIACATTSFERKYPDRELLPNWSRVFLEESDFVVVWLCERGTVKPPRRTWWRVDARGDCVESTLDQVSALKPVPPWR